MAKTVTIEVPEGFETHKGVSHKVIIREPTYDDYCDLGETHDAVPSGDGFLYPMENKATVRAYMERLVIEPADKIILGNIPMKYAREVRATILGFFRSSPKEDPSTTSGASSSTEQAASSPQST